MFNKLKQFKDLRNQAKTIQNALAGETTTVEKNGIKVVINGNMEITQININESLAKNNLEKTLTDCLNEAIKKTQRLMAKKIQEMGGIQGLN
ncbi:YbaB/EbfC family nucleoid-associated protein [Patescibacteria group bacterium]|nr:YbaB/EbfC family nucleoid-associated protein [Patescibacteria group bacterium]MBU1062860.1 YbaB/EbfC family nucleoid-associated protein [Patescibacteria group bacterium]